jgi:transposase-like protein
MELIKLLSICENEDACKALFKEYRDKKGVTCKRCGCRNHTYIKTVEKYQCKECSWQTTLRSGTLLEASKLPYRYWFFAISMMTSIKKSISAKEMQRQLGHSRYEPIWAMMHKIRAAMGKHDEKYTLDGLIELDDAFFKTHNDDQDKPSENKRGRGTTEKSTVLVMCKVDSGDPNQKHKKGTSFRYVKMLVLPNQKGDTINQAAQEALSNDSIVISDNFRSFSGIKNLVNKHLAVTLPPKMADKVLPWVHTTISNAKRQLLGTHSGVKNIYLQNYLNEYCYKTNRRNFGFNLFERFMGVAVQDTWYKLASL